MILAILEDISFLLNDKFKRWREIYTTCEDLSESEIHDPVYDPKTDTRAWYDPMSFSSYKKGYEADSWQEWVILYLDKTYENTKILIEKELTKKSPRLEKKRVVHLLLTDLDGLSARSVELMDIPYINTSIVNRYLETIKWLKEYIIETYPKYIEERLSQVGDNNLKSFDTKEDREQPKGSIQNFRWLGQDSETKIAKLYEGLKPDYIDNDTKLIDFRLLFTQETITSLSPITWVNEHYLIAYLIKELQDAGFLKKHLYYHSINEQHKCFISSKTGKPILNLKQLMNYLNYFHGGTPPGQAGIDSIVQSLGHPFN